MYNLIGLMCEKSKRVVWEKIMVKKEDGDYKMVWYNRETEEEISTYKLNRLKDRDKYIELWGKN